MHDVCPMCFNRARTDIQDGCHLFIALAFRQQLDNFPLARRQVPSGRSVQRSGPAAQELGKDEVGYTRGKNGLCWSNASIAAMRF